ncbi:hypothetical protein AB0H07_22510 [Streptomyces sp. NPDC021354]|uniref:hypothetical protein n=1 Tax=Streptomyces sp. NPDC021354 TaxID=3154793 RepID=UPI0033CF4DEB
MYGTWGDPEPLQEELIADEEWRAGTHLSVQEIAGQRVLRFSGRPPNPAAPRSRYAEEPREAGRTEVEPGARRPTPDRSAPSAPRRRGPVRRLAADVLPPVVTRAIRRRSGGGR